jgi:fermentation-respiration switch protein FrsA (DUF1100 family)
VLRISKAGLKRLLAVIGAILLVYVIGSCIAGVLLAEAILHPPHRPIENRGLYQQVAEQQYHAALQDVALTARDGVRLAAWYMVPGNDNGNAVMILHGQADNREGVFGYAKPFLARGYRVLLPDSRAHGESGGTLATCGLREADDVHRWSNLLYAQNAQCVYGLGESMGASILLQSLNMGRPFCAVAAESAFSTLSAFSYERAAQYWRLPPSVAGPLMHLPVDMEFVYAHLRYGLALDAIRPRDYLVYSTTPVLLIHGKLDTEILPYHSEVLHRADTLSQLWLVPDAPHSGAWNVAPLEFESRVTDFFASHTNGAQPATSATAK